MNTQGNQWAVIPRCNFMLGVCFNFDIQLPTRIFDQYVPI